MSDGRRDGIDTGAKGGMVHGGPPPTDRLDSDPSRDLRLIAEKLDIVAKGPQPVSDVLTNMFRGLARQLREISDELRPLFDTHRLIKGANDQCECCLKLHPVELKTTKVPAEITCPNCLASIWFHDSGFDYLCIERFGANWYNLTNFDWERLRKWQQAKYTGMQAADEYEKERHAASN